jgi:hypothetical protein
VYLSRPPITPPNSAKAPSVPLHQGKGNKTTVQVADNALRHPVTQRFQKRFSDSLQGGPVQGATVVRRPD